MVGGETVREPDGLALSSRNRYLSPAERTSALALSRALAAGHRGPLDAEPGLDVDYFERVDSATFAADPAGDLLVVAARVGTTRLIDNRPLDARPLDARPLDARPLDACPLDQPDRSA